MTVKNLIYFLSGGVIGVIASGLYFKKKYSEIANKQILDMEDYYERCDEYARKNADSNDTMDDYESKSDIGELSLDEARNIRKGKSEDRIPYHKIYGSNADDSKKETPEYNADQWHENHFDKPCEILTADEIEGLPPFIDTRTLFYYADEDILTDEEDCVIADRELIIGDENFLQKLCNDAEDVKKIIWVMNYKFDTLYEIQSVTENIGED